MSKIGYKQTEEHKRKRSEALLKRKKELGYINSPETRKKMSLALTGRKFSPELRKKCSDTAKKFGFGKWMKGKKLSLETRQKIGQHNKGKTKGEKHYKWKGGLPTCVDCGKTLSLNTCVRCRKCVDKYRVGDKNPAWKGGVTPENAKIRNSIEYSLWRESVFARDNWTCQKCKIKGGVLRGHHIENFSRCHGLRTSIENGITFCRNCHSDFHKKYGIKNNNEEQILEFIIVEHTG